MKRINLLLLTLSLTLPAAGEELVPLKITLPSPVFKGTPNSAESDFLEPRSDAPRAPYMVPEGTVLLSAHAKVSSSDAKATGEQLAKITDGKKEAIDENITALRRGPQWVQLDLGAPKTIYAIVLWHSFDDKKIVHGVVVQLSNDPGVGTTTVFNNDRDNKCGEGAGKDLEYFETFDGKLLGVPGKQARYVRCYSNGNTSMSLNEYIEIEVFGKP